MAGLGVTAGGKVAVAEGAAGGVAGAGATVGAADGAAGAGAIVAVASGAADAVGVVVAGRTVGPLLDGAAMRGTRVVGFGAADAEQAASNNSTALNSARLRVTLKVPLRPRPHRSAAGDRPGVCAYQPYGSAVGISSSVLRRAGRS